MPASSDPARSPDSTPSSTAAGPIPSRAPCAAAVTVTSAYRTPSAAESRQNSYATRSKSAADRRHVRTAAL